MQLDSSVESILLEPFMPNTIAGNIVIAELMYNPSGSEIEWVVLYNPTNAPVNLTGWRFRAAGVAFGTVGSVFAPSALNPTCTILAKGYYLVGEGATVVPGGVITDHAAGNMPFQNAGSRTDGAQLRDGTGGGANTIDTVLYDAPNLSGLDDNTGGVGTSFAPDAGEGNTIKRKSDSSGYTEGQGNGYITNASGNDFFVNTSPSPKNSASPTEEYTGETEGTNYLPTFVNTSKRGPSTSLGFWQIGSDEQHGLTHAPVFKMVFADIADIITQGAPTIPLVSAPLNEISGIKIWGVGNTNDDGVTFPLDYINKNPKLDIYLNKFQFVNSDGEARLPIERTDIGGPPHGGAPVNFNITGYKKKTFPITF